MTADVTGSQTSGSLPAVEIIGAGSWVDDEMADESEYENEPLPPCPRCKVAYRLVGIEPTEKPHHDLYTFECPTCGHLETREIRLQ